MVESSKDATLWTLLARGDHFHPHRINRIIVFHYEEYF